MKSYDTRLEQLRELYPSANWSLFNSLNFLPSAPDKNNLTIVVLNMSDGVGDYIHAKHFSVWFKQLLAPFGYTVTLLLQTDFTSDSKEEGSIDYVINDLTENGHKFCDKYWIFCNEEDFGEEEPSEFDEWLKREENADLIDYLQRSIGVIEVSAAVAEPLEQFLTEKIAEFDLPFIQCLQYGMDKNPEYRHYPLFTNLLMGLPTTDSSIAAGIEINDEITQHSPESILFRIEKEEGRFISHLLSSTEPASQESIATYLRTHHFMPGYIQNTQTARMFIASNVAAHGEAGLCDFLLPNNVVDENEIRSFLKETGLIKCDNEIAFIRDPLQDIEKKARIRIFTLRIASDVNYDSLYGLSCDSAGCSGDNSTTLVFSGRHLPFLEYKAGDIISERFYKRHLLKFINNCLNKLPPDDVLIPGMKNLMDYFNLLLTLSEVYLKTCPHETLTQLTYSLGRFQADPEVKKAWTYVNDKILRQCNIFHSLVPCIKYMMLFSHSPNQLRQMLTRTAEAKYLVTHDWISAEDMDSMPMHFYGEFLNPAFAENLPITNRPTIHKFVFETWYRNQVLDVVHPLHELIESGLLQTEVLNDPSINVLVYFEFIPLNLSKVIKTPEALISFSISRWSKDMSAFHKSYTECQKYLTPDAWEAVFCMIMNIMERGLKTANWKQSFFIYKISKSMIDLTQDSEKEQWANLAEKASKKFAVLYAAQPGLFYGAPPLSEEVAEPPHKKSKRNP